MTQTNLLPKLAITGVASTIAAFGISTASAYAAIIGEFGFENGTTNFFEDVNPTLVGFTDDFNVTFSPITAGEQASTFNTSGVFTPPLPDAPPVAILDLDQVTGTFSQTSYNDNDSSGDISVGDTFEYQLINDDLIFDFDDGVTVTYGEGEIFLGTFDFDVSGNPIGVEFVEENEVNPEVTIAGDPDSPYTGDQVRESLIFSDLEGGEFGEYAGEVQIVEVVPEPGTILGLLVIGGLSLSLKRKKQL